MHFADLYPIIVEQIKEDGKVKKFVDITETHLQASVVQPFYNPGNKTYDFVVTGRSVLGFTLYDFVCRIYWAWDATRITTVLPSTFGRVYDPIWNYDGIESNIEYFIDPTAYKKYVEGHFHSSVAGYNVQHHYPWLDITVYAGGGALWSSGIR